MRNTLTLLFIVLTFGMSAQELSETAFSITVFTDDHGSELSWMMYDSNAEPIIGGSQYANNSFYWYGIHLEPGSYTIDINDSGCNGFATGGHISMVSPAGILTWSTSNNFGCYQGWSMYYDGYTFCPTIECPEDSCPADLDENGIVGVSDLLLFIAAYGTICE